MFQSTQITDDVTYSFGYRYDLLGNLVQERYPSGRVVSTPHDYLSRVTGVSDATRVYASNYRHSLHGVPVSLKLGNALWETTRFNDRLQPILVGLGSAPDQEQPNFLSLSYEYWPGGAFHVNNGNVLKQTIVASGQPAMVQTYTYDAVNRLKTTTETNAATQAIAWSQTYGYDRFGNRWVSAGYIPQARSTPVAASHFDPATNRLLLGSSQFDFAGNLTQDPRGAVSTYDAENRATTANSGNVTYRYDGEGRRVLKQIGNEKTVYVYDALGRLVAEYGGPPVFAGLRYLTKDPLGSTRIVTDQVGTVVGRHDFLPFGEEIPKTVGPRVLIGAYEGLDAVRHRFTGKERDFETGRDYFGARYFSGSQGRFTSPDPALTLPQALMDPQQWNRYTYVRNNPLRYVDPEGESFLDVVNGWVNAVGSNAIVGLGRTIPNNADYRTGQAAGDRFSLAFGLLEAKIGIGGGAVLALPSGGTVAIPAGAMIAHGSAMAATATFNLAKNSSDESPSPALKGDPYHPDSVDSRVRPEYRPNPAHDPSSPSFNPNKTPEPSDAAAVYKTAVRGDMGTWYGRGMDGQIYRFFFDNAGGVHFSGTLRDLDVPQNVLKQLQQAN